MYVYLKTWELFLSLQHCEDRTDLKVPILFSRWGGILLSNVVRNLCLLEVLNTSYVFIISIIKESRTTQIVFDFEAPTI